MAKQFRIGEISALFGIGVDSIRYYEALGIIHPTRGENGYRLYSMGDIWRINVIRDLRSLGFSMDRIRAYLEGRTVDSTMDLLTQEMDAVTQRLDALRRRLANLQSRRDVIMRAQDMAEGVIHRRTYGARRCHILHEGYATDEEMDVLMQRLLRIDHSRLYIIGSNRIGSVLDGAAMARGDWQRYQAVFIIDDGGTDSLAAGEYLTVSYRGRAEKNAVYAPMLLAHAQAHGLRPVGDMLEILLIDIHESADYAEHVNELQIRVEM